MTVRPNDATPGSRTGRYRLAGLIAAAAMAGAAVGLAGIYGIDAVRRNAGTDAGCRAALETAGRLAPLARGEVAAVTVASKATRIPPLAFQDPNGKALTLEPWRGRVVLLNLWATWCVPCRKEMPALDALQAKLGGPRFDVVAINIDTRDPDKPRKWFADVGIKNLAYYADPSAKVFQELKAAGKAFGMPATLIVDPQGCELATLAGPAEWASDEAIALIEAAIAASSSGGSRS
jgi:thiol-disulfide isomerase/thioredoxin